MEYIRKCDVYPTTQCNCPVDTCRREQTEKEIELSKVEAEQKKQKFIEDLIDFQFFLRDEGLINDEDWAYEDQAILFYNQTKAYESN
jgi:hypothetical protein